MNYRELNATAHNGDLISVSGNSLISKTIRAATMGKMSHIAILYWAGTQLMVYEFKEFVGQRFTPAHLYVDDLLEAEINCYWNHAPVEVRSQPDVVVDYLMSRRKEPYGYWALAQVLYAQYSGKDVASDLLVCSIIAQRAYEQCGVTFERLASPQMMPDYCTMQSKLTL